MGIGIIVCGLNGCGKSTFGKALADKLNCKFMDIEDYYFPKTNNNYIYASPRTRAEVAELLYDDLKKRVRFVLASVRGDFGDEIEALFSFAVLISVPKEIRMERVRNRSFQNSGAGCCTAETCMKKKNSFLMQRMSNRRIIRNNG